MILTLDFSSDIPIYQQIRNAIVKAIADGEFREGEKLPTVRALAQEAGINVMTVNKAYQLLKQESYIITDRRNGAAVHSPGMKGNERLLEEKKQKLAEELELIVAEAKLNRVPEEELVQLLREMYGRQNVGK